MTDKIIKQVPNILENPIAVMSSKTVEGRLTLFGEVYAKGKPVLAVLELSPQNRKGIVLDELKIASAYGKDNAQKFLDKSEIVYQDNNQKRVTDWEKRTGLQLPVGDSYDNSTNSIPDSAEKVNRGSKEICKDGRRYCLGIAEAL